MNLSRHIVLAAIYLAIAPPAPGQTPPPAVAVGDITVSGSLRTRTYAWNWFGSEPEGEYRYQGSVVRFGLSRSKHDDWQVELELPFILGAPATAVAPPPRGQLGLGAAYYAANDNHSTAAALFLKQAAWRFNGLGGVTGQSLKIGRWEFNDGSELAPKNASLAALKRDRISQRLLGNFGFSDVFRSIDGAQYVFDSPTLNVTGLAGRPTEGVFQVNGWNELDINVFYGSITRQTRGNDSPADWRIAALVYDDRRRGVSKTDNRPDAVRNADNDSILIAMYGGHYIQLLATPRGPVDLLAWAFLQSGSWGALDHRAAALALEAGWQPQIAAGWKPWIRFGFDYSSGDGDPNDNQHGTFFQALPTARVYARTPFFDLMNNVDIFGELILRPTTTLTIRSDIHGLSLADSNDLWYSGGGAFQPATFGFSGRPSNGHAGLATLSDVSGDLTLNRHIAVGLYYGYATSRAVPSAIFSTGNDAGAHLAFLEVTMRL
jgi:hypothetical protein